MGCQAIKLCTSDEDSLDDEIKYKTIEKSKGNPNPHFLTQ